jgi:hypothetical protein
VIPAAAVPPGVQVIVAIALLGAAYAVWPQQLLAVLGVVVLYLVLTHGAQVGTLLDKVPTMLGRLIIPAAGVGLQRPPR